MTDFNFSKPGTSVTLQTDLINFNPQSTSTFTIMSISGVITDNEKIVFGVLKQTLSDISTLVQFAVTNSLGLSALPIGSHINNTGPVVIRELA